MLPFLWLVPLGAPFAKAMCCNGFTVQNIFEPFDVATICLDGRELTTSYCGVGPCNSLDAIATAAVGRQIGRPVTIIA